MFKNKTAVWLLALVMLALPTACDKEYLSPSNPDESSIAGSVDGLTALAVGLQRRYSFGRQSPVYSTITGAGFTAQELRIINAGNTDENNLGIGGQNVDGSNAVVGQLWTQSFLLIREADVILNNISEIEDAGVKSGLQGYATIFKALAYGTLATFFESSPIAIQENAPFVSRTAVLEEAVSLLEDLKTVLATAPVSSTFLSRVPAGINVPNTVNALLARYYTMLGDSQAALAAAEDVDLSVTSAFRYDDTNPNPIANVSILTNNVFQPINGTLGLPASLAPDPDDKRLTFYLTTLTPTPPTDFRAVGFFDANNTSIPIYLPGEVMLVKAEAYARMNMLTEAVEALNEVLNKTPEEDAWGVGADLDDYSGAVSQDAILTEIYRQRSIELFMSGLRLEDSRRFGRPGPGTAEPERNRSGFYPYPFIERDNNGNTPEDPAL